MNELNYYRVPWDTDTEIRTNDNDQINLNGSNAMNGQFNTNGTNAHAMNGPNPWYPTTPINLISLYEQYMDNWVLGNQESIRPKKQSNITMTEI